MGKPKITPYQTAKLRKEAEKLLKKKILHTVPELSEAETIKLIHEVEVHQIELDLQNQELSRTVSAAEDAIALYDFAPSGYFTMSQEGVILRLNFNASEILGKERSLLINNKFCVFVTDDTKQLFNDFLENVFFTRRKESCEVTLSVIDRLPVHVHLTAIVGLYGDYCLMTMNDITERKQLDETQAFLLQTGYPGSGEDFFQSLARYLAHSLGMDYVCIDRIDGEGLTAQTVAVFNDGKFDANLSYTLKDTPCGEVVEKTICCFTKDVCRLFPHDPALRELNAESYAGTTLWGFDGKPIGLIAVIGRKPLSNPDLAKAVLKLASLRAAGELERTQRAAELQQSKQRLEMAQISSGAGIWDWDMVTQSLHWSEELFLLFGLDPLKDQATFETWGNIIHPDDKKIAQARLDQAIKSKQQLNSEYRVIYNGELHWIAAMGNTTYDESDHPVRMTGICMDITLRKQAEEALRVSEDRLRMITENAPDMIVELDRHGTILYMNRVLPGYRMEEVIGKNVSGWILPEYIPLIMEALERTFSDALPQSIQVRGFGTDAELRWYLARLSPVKVAGQVKNAIAIITDITERIQKEDTIRESEKRRLAILETALDGFWLFDMQGRLLEVNETYCRMSGYSAPELLTMKIPDLEDIETLDETNAHIQKIMVQGEDRFESRHRRNDGSVFDVEISIQYIPTEGGQFVSFLHDITERKQAEEALKANERLLRESQAVAHIGSYSADLNTKTWQASPEIYEIFGIDKAYPQELESWAALIHPDWREKYFEYSRKVVAERIRFDLEYQIIRLRDGQERWVHRLGELEYDDELNPVRLVGTVQDITKRKQIEIELYQLNEQLEQRVKMRTAELLILNEALQKSEEKFRTIADYTYDWEFWTNNDGSYNYVSPACERITGYSAQEFMNDPQLIFKIIHPDDSVDYFNHVLHQFHAKESCEMEFRIETKEGTERYIGHVCRPVFGANGEFLGKRGSNRDITEKIGAEIDLINVAVEVEERERNLFSIELHDGLGPLLSTIKLYFQWLAETDNPEKIKIITEKGNNNIERAIQTTRDMAHGLSSLNLNNSGYVDAVLNFTQSINDTKKLTIDFTFNTRERIGNFLEITLYRITTELISNTLKYANANHVVIEFDYDQEKHMISFHYSDNGIGFELAALKKTNKGLGLLNIQQRIRILRGTINIEASHRQGMKVNIKLPVHKTFISSGPETC